MINHGLEVRQLSVSFNSRRKKIIAVDDISFHIPKGQVLGVVGESGSGKTVTALSLLRLFTPSMNAQIYARNIMLNGRSIYDLSESEINKIRGREISFIFQEPMTALHPSFKVGYQIQESILLSRHMEKEEAKNIVLQFLQMVELNNCEHIYNQYPFELSGGMRQRIMIAMALASNPSLLIADEPTTSLDILVQKEILSLLKKLHKIRNLTTLFITHDISVANKISDLIMIMYAGRICEFGTKEDVLHNPIHPYTKSLLNSVPTLENNKTRFPLIDQKEFSSLNKGCSFYIRCPQRTTSCDKARPRLLKMNDSKNRKVSCFLYE